MTIVQYEKSTLSTGEHLTVVTLKNGDVWVIVRVPGGEAVVVLDDGVESTMDAFREALAKTNREVST